MMDGERCRDDALRLLRDRRAALVCSVQRAYLALLLDSGPSATDPAWAAVPIPDEIARRMGDAAVRQLTGLDLIERAGLSRSVGPEAHGRDLPLCTITDRAGARAWLAAHPDLSTSIPRTTDSVLFGTDHRHSELAR
jgi:hypothetical protein